jgi:hypothetical protein
LTDRDDDHESMRRHLVPLEHVVGAHLGDAHVVGAGLGREAPDLGRPLGRRAFFGRRGERRERLVDRALSLGAGLGDGRITAARPSVEPALQRAVRRGLGRVPVDG